LPAIVRKAGRSSEWLPITEFSKRSPKEAGQLPCEDA